MNSGGSILIRPKRLATNSMINAYKKCRRKYMFRYIDGIEPIRRSVAANFGAIFHKLYHEIMAGNGDDSRLESMVSQWVSRLIEEQKRLSATTGRLALSSIVSDYSDLKEEAIKIGKNALELAQYHRDNTWKKDGDRFQVIFAEKNFSIPLINRGDQRHKVWRFVGRWDLVVWDKLADVVIVRDLKTTAGNPSDTANTLSIGTQPIAYLLAAKYLDAVRPKSAHERKRREKARQSWSNEGRSEHIDLQFDGPDWPDCLPKTVVFEHELIRKKLPAKPVPVKDGSRLSRQITDTTAEIYRAAIAENGFNSADYAEILDNLEHRGPAFHLRQQVTVDDTEISRWEEETRMVLEEIQAFERAPGRAYRTSPDICRRDYGRPCEYLSLCYGDPGLERENYKTRQIHAELAEDEGGSDE